MSLEPKPWRYLHAQVYLSEEVQRYVKTRPQLQGKLVQLYLELTSDELVYVILENPLDPGGGELALQYWNKSSRERGGKIHLLEPFLARRNS